MSESPPAQDNIPILLATNNPAKQDTLRWLLEGLALSPVTPQELGLEADPEEEGETHGDIARVKAREWSLASSMLSIATDGGLVIPALGKNWESRFTHRFAGPAADDAERSRRLLEFMRPHWGKDREASWMEALAIGNRGQVEASWNWRAAPAESPIALATLPKYPGSGYSPCGAFPSTATAPTTSYPRKNGRPSMTTGPSCATWCGSSSTPTCRTNRDHARSPGQLCIGQAGRCVKVRSVSRKLANWGKGLPDSSSGSSAFAGMTRGMRQ